MSNQLDAASAEITMPSHPALRPLLVPAVLGLGPQARTMAGLHVDLGEDHNAYNVDESKEFPYLLRAYVTCTCIHLETVFREWQRSGAVIVAGRWRLEVAGGAQP
jgi:hypothetical protein